MNKAPSTLLVMVRPFRSRVLSPATTTVLVARTSEVSFALPSPSAERKAARASQLSNVSPWASEVMVTSMEPVALAAF